jgi:thiamine biosynthesis lipoprotein
MFVISDSFGCQGAVKVAMKRSRTAVRLFAAIAAVFFTAQANSGQEQKKPQRHEFEETHMGARVRILLYTNEPEVAKRAATAAFGRVAQLDKTFSDYDNGSELMRLVTRFANEPAEPVAVSDDLFDILTKSEAISVSTGGVFDITTAPLIRQWRRAFREKKLPTAENLSEARERVGFRRIRRIEAGRKIALEPGTRIDLGAIAKGYTAKAAIDVLKEQGIASALVAIAGDISVSAAPPGETGWLVDVAGLNPLSDPHLARVRLTNASISTSGDAERFVEIDGRRYSHIVDPRTGFGVTRRATVTVISQHGFEADAYSTSLYLLGVQGSELTDNIHGVPPLAVSWFEAKSDGTVDRRTNQAFDALPRD